MIATFFTWLATALSLLIVDLVVPGVDLRTFPAALIAAISIGLVNAVIKPVLSVLSLPLNFVTLGGFSLIVNGVCFWLASVLVPGFSVNGVLAFLLGPIVLSLANTFISNYFVEKNTDLKLAGVSKDDLNLAPGKKAELNLEPERKVDLKTES